MENPSQVPLTSQATADAYVGPWYQTYYDVYFHELLAEELLQRWQTFDTVARLLVAVTASGSAIAAWPLWATPGGRFFWTILAGAAALASVAHGVLAIAGRVRELEKIRRLYSDLRLALETFRQDLEIGLTQGEAKARIDGLRNRRSDANSWVRFDILTRSGLRKRVQEKLNGELTEKGYI